MKQALPITPASIEQGLSSEDAKIWDEAEKIKREECLQKALSAIHQDQTAITGAVSVSVDEDTEDSFSDDDEEDPDTDNSESGLQEAIKSSDNSNSIADSDKENIPRYDASHISSDIIPQDPPTPYLETTNSNLYESNPLIQAHIQSLELQISHLRSQNHSLHNTIARDQQTLEQMSFANSQYLEQIHLLKAHFQHLLPPPSTDSDPSMSNSNCILPTLPELRGEQLHQAKIELIQTKQELHSTLSKVTFARQESNLQINVLTAQNTALKSQLKSLQDELTKLSHFSNDSQRQIQNQVLDQTRVEKHLEKQLHVLQGQLYTLTQDQEQRKEKEEENIQAITTLEHTRELQQNQINTLNVQYKKDQSEIAALLEERNALRGQLDEIQLQSLSGSNPLDSQFQQEIHRLQTSYSKSKQGMIDKLSSLQSLLDEKTKQWKETKRNEAYLLRKLQELKKGCNVLIQMLFRLEREKLLFQSKSTMSVKEMVNYAWRGLTDSDSKELFVDENKGQNKDDEHMTYVHVATQTNHAKSNLISFGTNTDEGSTNSTNRNQQDLGVQIRNMMYENQTLNESKQLLQEQLQHFVTQNHRDSTDNSSIINELNRITEENNTLQKSKKYIQEENRKLVEQRIQIENLFDSSKVEKKRLQNRLDKFKEDITVERSNQKKKMEKLKKEMDHIGEERDYWEKKAENLKKELEYTERKTNALDSFPNNPTAAVSFDQSSQLSSETPCGSLRFDSPQSGQAKMDGSVLKNTNSQLEQIDNMKALIAHKDTVISALTEHLADVSESNAPRSLSQTLGNPDTSIKEWLEKWESTMDHHVTETTETIANALYSGLNLLIDDLMHPKEEGVTIIENQDISMKDSMDQYLDNMAAHMATELQNGLQMIQNFREKEGTDQSNIDIKQDGELLQDKLKQLLRTIDDQQAIVEKQEPSSKVDKVDRVDACSGTKTPDHSQLNAVKMPEIQVQASSSTVDAGIQTVELKRALPPGTEKSAMESGHDIYDSDEKRNFIGTRNVSEKAVQAENRTVDYGTNLTDEIQNELIRFLQTIKNEKDLHASKNEKSDASTVIDIIPGMSTKAIDASSPVVNASMQTVPLYNEEVNTLKEKLIQALSQCSKLEKDKQQLEITFSETKETLESKFEKMRLDKENEIKFYKLHLDSTYPLKTVRNETREDEDIIPKSNPENSLHERLYRIRQSAERAALISKHEEEQAALISECNSALRSKINSFNNEVDKAVEKNMEEVRKERDEFVQFACLELKKEYNNRIEKLLQRHQEEIEEAKEESSMKDYFDEKRIRTLEAKHAKKTQILSDQTFQNREENLIRVPSIDLVKNQEELSSIENEQSPAFAETKQKDAEFDSAVILSPKRDAKIPRTKHIDVLEGERDSRITPVSNNRTKNPKPTLARNEVPAGIMTVFTPTSDTVVNLFQNKPEFAQYDTVEESFHDIEDFVVGVLNDCEMTQQLSQRKV